MAAPCCFQKKVTCQRQSFLTVETVQVNLGFDHPVAAAQLAQRHARHAGPDEQQLVAGFHGVIGGARTERLRQHGLLVEAGLARMGCRTLAPRLAAAWRSERRYSGERLAEVLVIRWR